jgi:hypothetical protein
MTNDSLQKPPSNNPTKEILFAGELLFQKLQRTSDLASRRRLAFDQLQDIFFNFTKLKFHEVIGRPLSEPHKYDNLIKIFRSTMSELDEILLTVTEADKNNRDPLEDFFGIDCKAPELTQTEAHSIAIVFRSLADKLTSNYF